MRQKEHCLLDLSLSPSPLSSAADPFLIMHRWRDESLKPEARAELSEASRPFIPLNFEGSPNRLKESFLNNKDSSKQWHCSKGQQQRQGLPDVCKIRYIDSSSPMAISFDRISRSSLIPRCDYRLWWLR